MDIPFSRYTEKLPEEFSVRHKITETTEKKNFHLHRQMEIIFALSGNLKCKFETGEIDIPRNGLILYLSGGRFRNLRPVCAVFFLQLHIPVLHS